VCVEGAAAGMGSTVLHVHARQVAGVDAGTALSAGALSRHHGGSGDGRQRSGGAAGDRQLASGSRQHAPMMGPEVVQRGEELARRSSSWGAARIGASAAASRAEDNVR
jgi:hypothetical protein